MKLSQIITSVATAFALSNSPAVAQVQNTSTAVESRLVGNNDSIYTLPDASIDKLMASYSVRIEGTTNIESEANDVNAKLVMTLKLIKELRQKSIEALISERNAIVKSPIS
jgi:hypothetical protein